MINTCYHTVFLLFFILLQFVQGHSSGQLPSAGIPSFLTLNLTETLTLFLIYFRKNSEKTMSSILLVENTCENVLDHEKLSLYKHWIREYLFIQPSLGSLFQIQSMELGHSNECLPSSNKFFYYIDGNSIKLHFGNLPQ